jgi:Cu-Zn family superoxide dismutase
MQPKRVTILPFLSITLGLTLALFAAVGCAGDGDDTGDADGSDAAEPLEAEAALDPASGSTVVGEADFEPDESNLALIVAEVEIEGAPPGEHGVHIHAVGDCGNDAMNAGDHWDPDAGDHGMPGADPSHLGDLGNMTVTADGLGSLTFANPTWTLGDGSDTDLLGKAIIIHELADDFGQPLGNAGARIACGVIEPDVD